nr:uncharacterized protein LOC123855150 [Mirounga angustirostris]
MSPHSPATSPAERPPVSTAPRFPGDPPASCVSPRKETPTSPTRACCGPARDRSTCRSPAEPNRPPLRSDPSRGRALPPPPAPPTGLGRDARGGACAGHRPLGSPGWAGLGAGPCAARRSTCPRVFRLPAGPGRLAADPGRARGGRARNGAYAQPPPLSWAPAAVAGAEAGAASAPRPGPRAHREPREVRLRVVETAASGFPVGRVDYSFILWRNHGLRVMGSACPTAAPGTGCQGDSPPYGAHPQRCGPQRQANRYFHYQA